MIDGIQFIGHVLGWGPNAITAKQSFVFPKFRDCLGSFQKLKSKQGLHFCLCNNYNKSSLIPSIIT